MLFAVVMKEDKWHSQELIIEKRIKHCWIHDLWDFENHPQVADNHWDSVNSFLILYKSLMYKFIIVE